MCLDKMSEERGVKQLACGHHFHSTCLLHWLLRCQDHQQVRCALALDEPLGWQTGPLCRETHVFELRKARFIR